MSCSKPLYSRRLSKSASMRELLFLLPRERSHPARTDYDLIPAFAPRQEIFDRRPLLISIYTDRACPYGGPKWLGRPLSKCSDQQLPPLMQDSRELFRRRARGTQSRGIHAQRLNRSFILFPKFSHFGNVRRP